MRWRQLLVAKAYFPLLVTSVVTLFGCNGDKTNINQSNHQTEIVDSGSGQVSVDLNRVLNGKIHLGETILASSHAQLGSGLNKIWLLLDDDALEDDVISDVALATTTADRHGNFSIWLTDQALEKIYPQVVDGMDGPRGGLFILAESPNQGFLIAGLTRNNEDWLAINISDQTTAYGVFLDLIGRFSAEQLAKFPGKNGLVDEQSPLRDFIQDLAIQVSNDFHTGEILIDGEELFSRAIQSIEHSFLAEFTAGKQYINQSVIVAGGIAKINSAVTEVRSVDGTAIVDLGGGYYRIGSSSEYKETFLHLIIGEGDEHRLASISLRPRDEVQIARQQVTPQSGATLGNGTVSMRLHPFSLQQDTEITLTQVTTEGETIHGRPILRMEPSGLQFDRPVEVTINYQGVGVDDPDAVDWLYGSETQGYQSADIVGVDRLAGNITLSVQHFSEILVNRSASGVGAFLDLGHNFVTIIPSREERYNLTNNIELGRAQRFITNRVLSGASPANRTIDYSEFTSINGGHCAQSAAHFFFPLIHGVSPIAYGAVNVRDNNRWTARTSATDCQRGDWLTLYNTGVNSHGHTAIYQSHDASVVNVLETNYRLGGTTFPPANRRNSSFWHFMFGIDSELNHAGYGRGINQFQCFSPEATGGSVTSFTRYNEVRVEEKPWLYYLVSEQNNGKTALADGSFEFDPDLFPVAPLRVNHQQGRSVIRDTQAARYAIYASNPSANYSASWANDLTVAPMNSDNGFSFPAGSNGEQVFMTRLQVPSHRFPAELRPGVPHPHAGQPARYAKSWMMLNADYSSRKLEASENTSVLYSPIVIDDAYVNYSANFSWNCAPGDVSANCVRIGMQLTDVDGSAMGNKLEFRGEVNSALLSDSIYQSNTAVNGYFSTIGFGSKATWNFAHAGLHSVYVNLPMGLDNDQLAATYTLRLGASEDVISLKVCDLVVYPFNGFRWHRLVKVNSQGNCPDQLVDSDVLFNLTGWDSLHLHNQTNAIVQVDAIQLVTVEEAERDNVQTARLFVNAEGSLLGVWLRHQLHFCGDNGCRQIQSGEQSLIQDGVSLQFSQLPTGTYKLNLLPFLREQNELQSFASQSRGLNQNVDRGYLPETVYFTVDDDFSGTLPSVVLRRDGQRNVNIRVVDSVTGNIIPNVKVNVRYGAGRDDDTVAFSGQTNNSGVFSIAAMPYGTYTASIAANEYARILSRIDVGDNTESQVTIIATQNIAIDKARIVLSWGANPRDLDSHLLRFTNGNLDYRVFYGSPTAVDAQLDRDVTSGYGPETITINPMSTDKTYRYIVHHYSGSSDIASSGAVVSLTYGNSSRSFYPPNEQGRYWHVFDVISGKVVPCQSGCMSGQLPDSFRLQRSVPLASEFQLPPK